MYLYILRSNVCKCGHPGAKHNQNGCVTPDCKCEELYYKRYEMTAETIREAAEKLKLKLDDIVYQYKTKL